MHSRCKVVLTRRMHPVFAVRAASPSGGAPTRPSRQALLPLSLSSESLPREIHTVHDNGCGWRDARGLTGAKVTLLGRAARRRNAPVPSGGRPHGPHNLLFLLLYSRPDATLGPRLYTLTLKGRIFHLRSTCDQLITPLKGLRA